ncbi:MAG TPA: hypothetical protein VKV29_12775 [Chthonomonas sp.]|jgi:hypothetical protein|uniref:hypothetical protein n=1 Tax=Chthonomonas sp. TaxID=2282153 RepID=UPI002B4B06D4|nr:hypothetical protein [Chthonomonas sp.]HLH81142.1 hypothetical protein [Chthonomonas sp.]
MLVSFLSLLNGTSPGTCLARSAAAFLVFAGFGLVLRYALTEGTRDGILGTALLEEGREEAEPKLDVIVPGTTVADLLGVKAENQGEGNSK